MKHKQRIFVNASFNLPHCHDPSLPPSSLKIREITQALSRFESKKLHFERWWIWEAALWEDGTCGSLQREGLGMKTRNTEQKFHGRDGEILCVRMYAFRAPSHEIFHVGNLQHKTKMIPTCLTSSCLVQCTLQKKCNSTCSCVWFMRSCVRSSPGKPSSWRDLHSGWPCW